MGKFHTFIHILALSSNGAEHFFPGVDRRNRCTCFLYCCGLWICTFLIARWKFALLYSDRDHFDSREDHIHPYLLCLCGGTALERDRLARASPLIFWQCGLYLSPAS